MEFEKQFLQDQVSLKEELALIFPHLSDDILWDTVLDYRNKNDLERCTQHILDRCKETRYQDETTSTKYPICDYSGSSSEGILHQACSMDAMHIPSPGYERRPAFLSDESFRGDNRQALRIVLLGKTGSGKSSTGNTILGEESFKTCFSASSVTEMCREVKVVRCGQAIHLVDSPGVFDTNKPNTQVLQEISRCISMSLPGPHVFLLVLQAGRFTPEENDTVKHIAEMFGEDVFEHMILVFTGRDALEKRQQSFEEFLQTIPPTLDKIREKCNGRCIAVDNSAGNESRTVDAGNLMEQVHGLVEKHNGKYYTNEMYKAAEKTCREREEEIRRQKDEEKRKEKDELMTQLSKEFQKDFDRLKAKQNMLEKKIGDITTEKEELVEKLQDSSFKDGEIAEIKKQLRIVEKDAQQYRKQAEDATHQRQVCLQNRERRMDEQLKQIDLKYRKPIVIDRMSTAEAVYTMIKGTAEVGWGLYNFFQWIE